MKFKKTLVIFVVFFLVSLFYVFPMTFVSATPSTVDTSTATYSNVVSFPFQRKVIDKVAGRSWVFYSNGSEMVYKSSTDGSTWSAVTVIKDIEADIAGSDFSVWFDGTYLHYAFASVFLADKTIYYRRGLPDSNGNITWSTVEQEITTTHIYVYDPFVSVDSNGYVWISYRDSPDAYATWYTYIVKSEYNNGTWGTTPSGFPYLFGVTADSTSEMSIIPLTSGKMLAIHGRTSATIKVKKWNGTDWGSQKATSSAMQDGYAFSAVADGDNVHIVFLNASNEILHVKYTYSSDSFGSETIIQSGATSAPPVLSINSTTGYLYCFWLNNPTENHVYYKKNVGGSWDSEATDWITEAGLTASSKLSSSYEAVNSKIALVYLNGSSPYQVRFDHLTTESANSNPTITNFQAPSTVYANKYFLLNCTVADADGNTTIVNATVEISNSVIYKYVTDTDTFSEDQDANNYSTLDAANSVRTEINSTSFKLSWKIKLNWTYPEGSVSVIVTNTKVYDAEGASGTGSQAELFTFEDDLVIHTDANVDDNRVDASQSITFSGTIYYQGTLAVPEDVSGITAYVELSGVQKGSDTNVASGQYSIAFNAESSYGEHSYNIYCSTDQNSEVNQTVNVVVDRVNVTDGGVSDNRCNYGDTELVWFKLHYNYDGVAFNTSHGTVYLNGSTMSWSSGNSRWEKNYTYSAAVKYSFQVTGITDSQYGLTGFEDAIGEQEIIWDRLLVSVNANSTNPDAGESIESNITATYEYSGITVTDWSLNVLRNETHFASGNFTDSSAGEITYQYTTENVTENTYGLTAFTSNTLTVIWANLFVEINQITVEDSRINVETDAVVLYHCRWSSNQSSCTSGTLYVNSTGFSINGSGWASVTFNFSIACQKTLVITDVNVDGETDYGQIPGNPTITWDRQEVYYFEVDDSHVNVGDSVEVRVRLRLDFDNHPLGSGDTVYINGSLATWDVANAWFEASYSNNTVCNKTFAVSSSSEATYNITVVYHAVSEPTVVWDQLEVYNLQTVEFLGSGQYRYKAQIRYAQSQDVISGASLRFKYPDGALSPQLSSNTTGWCTFILSQSNATQTGLYTLYGVNDNSYSITLSGANQTFTVHSLKLNSKDYEGNSLTGTTIKIYNSTTLVYSPGSEATSYYPQTSYSFEVYWLQNLLVNETASYSLSANSEVNLTCLCYNFTVNSVSYHVASNATISNTSWNSTTSKMLVTFNAATDTYILVCSAVAQPTYVLNCSYDLDVDFGTYLTLTHYGNQTITLGYPNWASTRIYSTDHSITNTYWSGGEILYVVLNGTAGQSGTLEVYCGSRATPRATSGLTDAVYFSGTTILAGTYSFSSTTTVSLDWTSDEGGGGSTPSPSIFVSAETIELGAIQQGTSHTFNGTALWTGIATITLTDVTFTGEGSEWLTYTHKMPLTIRRLAIETQGTIHIPITLTIPSQATLGNYKILIEYTIQVGTSTYQTTANIIFSVSSTPIPPGGLPAIISILLFFSLIGVVILGVKKH